MLRKEGGWKGGMQERRNAGKEEFRTGDRKGGNNPNKVRRDEGQEGFSAWDGGQVGCQTGEGCRKRGMQKKRDAGKE